jgi:hypothetical protein
MSDGDDTTFLFTMPLDLLVQDMGPHPESGKPSHGLPYTCSVGYNDCLVRAVAMFTSRQAADEFVILNRSAFGDAQINGLSYD